MNHNEKKWVLFLIAYTFTGVAAFAGGMLFGVYFFERWLP